MFKLLEVAFLMAWIVEILPKGDNISDNSDNGQTYCFLGKYLTRWRGITMMKDCLDMIIYEQLLWEVKPKTIFELGAYTGACALWMSDTMKTYGLPVHVYSVDIDMSLVDPLAKSDKSLTFIEGNVKHIEEAFPEELLKVDFCIYYHGIW